MILKSNYADGDHMDKEHVNFFIAVHNKLNEIKDYYLNMSHKLADFVALESMKDRFIDLENKEIVWQSFLDCIKEKIDEPLYFLLSRKCRILLLLPSVKSMVIGTTDELIMVISRTIQEAINSSTYLIFNEKYDVRFVLEKPHKEPNP